MQTMRMLVRDDRLQKVLDALQSVLGAQPTAKILVLRLEASLSKPPKDEDAREKAASAAREALYEELRQGATFDVHYILLVLSTYFRGFLL